MVCTNCRRKVTESNRVVGIMMCKLEEYTGDNSAWSTWCTECSRFPLLEDRLFKNFTRSEIQVGL